MTDLMLDDALMVANQLCLFARVYRMFEAEKGFLSPQENYLNAMEVVRRQTGCYIGFVPNATTHQPGFKC